MLSVIATRYPTSYIRITSSHRYKQGAVHNTVTISRQWDGGYRYLMGGTT